MPLNQIPQINGQSFDHAGITLVLFGRKVHGLTAVEYDEQVEKVNNYGTGTLPVSAGRAAPARPRPCRRRTARSADAGPVSCAGLAGSHLLTLL